MDENEEFFISGSEDGDIKVSEKILVKFIKLWRRDNAVLSTSKCQSEDRRIIGLRRSWFLHYRGWFLPSLKQYFFQCHLWNLYLLKGLVPEL